MTCPSDPIAAAKATRKDALETANDFLDQGIPVVTIEEDGRTYTSQEFALTVMNGEG